MNRRPVRVPLAAVVVATALAFAPMPASGVDEVDDELAPVRQLIKQGRYSDAETAVREVRRVIEARAGAESLPAARVLDVLVEALYRGGKAQDPEPRALAEKAVALKEAALGPEDPEVARSLNQLGNVLLSAAQYAAARPHYARALAIREKSLGPVHIDIAVSLHNLALVQWQMGEFDEVRSLYERALALDERIAGPESPEVAHVLNNLGLLRRDLGEYAEATRHLQRALAIKEKTLGPDHPDVALALNDLGGVLLDLGDWEAGRQLFARAVATDEKALGPHHPILALHLSNLGLALVELGRYSEAKLVFERARAIFDREAEPHRWAHNPLGGLAVVFYKTGDAPAGRALYERSLAILERTVGPDHPELGRSTWAFASNLVAAGDVAHARLVAQRATAILEKAEARESPVLAKALATLAEAEAAAGDLPAAFATALRAEAIGREHLRLTVRSLAERQGLAYAASRGVGLDLALGLLAGETLRRPNAAGEALDALVRSRALVLDEMAARHRVVAGTGDPEVRQRAEALTAARTRLARLVVGGAAGMDPEHFRGRVEEARRTKERAEQDLAEMSAAFREELAKTQFGLAEVRAALPAASALVSFVRYGRDAAADGSRGSKSPVPAPSYAALVLQTDAPIAVPLGGAEEIDALVARWRANLAQEARAAGRSSPRSEAAYRAVAAELRRRIWDPVAARIAGARHVFVVPDGALHLVNLAALPVGGTGYLAESGPRIQVLSAERDLAPIEAAAPARGLLAVGAPAFDQASPAAGRQAVSSTRAARGAAPGPAFRGARSSCASFESMRFEPLPASRHEAEEVARLWDLGRAAGYPAERALRLTGTEASEAAFKREGPGKRVLHLATHGFFLGDRCGSALERTANGGGGAPAASVGDNPLLLAGLVLAGANRRRATPAEEEDGILTAEEIAALDLRGTEWAVLSACDTGVGQVKAGEGVFGLRRAFQVAGVRTVIMSLWPVEDQTAREWAKALYAGRYVRQLSTVDAVRDATLALLQRRRAAKLSSHPFYWAAFIAAGG